jgi:hypothetical protein
LTAALTLDELLRTAGAIASLAAALAFLLLLPLYVSQRRDVRRLRDWMEREPAHPAADLAASEVILDRAEAELESLLGEAARPASTQAATRVTSERPALERVTMERAALVPHPRWRTFIARVTQPRAMIAIAAATVLLGAAAIFGSEQLLGGEEPKQRSGKAVIPSETTVAVLNGAPSKEGLAGELASELEAHRYVIGDITGATESSEQSVVLYTEGEKRAARRVAKSLEITAVQALDRATRERAGDDAEVVVIAGADRARR